MACSAACCKLRLLTSGSADSYIESGSSGIGELLANTFAVRNVTVVVLDVNEVESENCALANSLSAVPNLADTAFPNTTQR